MDGQRTRIADIGDVIEKLKCVDEAAPRLAPALQLEAEQRAIASGLQIGLGPPLFLAGRITREDDLRDLGVALQVLGHLHGILVVLADAQRQRLQPLNELEGVERADGGAHVAQQHGAGAQHIGDRPERLCRLHPHLAVIAGVRLVQRGEAFGMLLPRKVAAIDDGAADRGAVTADIFGGRVDDSRGTMLQRPDDERSGRVVDDQRHAEFAPDIRHFADREDVELRIGQGFRIIGFGALIRRPAEILRIGGIDETNLDAEMLQRCGKQRPCAAIEICGAHDIVAGAGKIEDGVGRCRLAGRHRQRRSTTLQSRQPLLEGILRGVGNAGVDMAILIQREQLVGMIGVPKLVGRGLIDRHRNRAGGGIGPIGAPVQGQSLRLQIFNAHDLLRIFRMGKFRQVAKSVG
jgi:hypothetical protein